MSRSEKLMNENKWLPNAIKMIGNRLIDKGLNINGEWMGYYDEYCLQFIQKTTCDSDGEPIYLGYGTVEVYSKEKSFNPYKFCRGEGYEYEKLCEFEMYSKHWRVVESYLRGVQEIDGKKVCFDNPNYHRVEFIDGSDVPTSGNYE